ncbi:MULTISPECIES: thioredoxin [Leptolyngbya]|jgi:thioredoxin 1|uniref:Thioredoxin n=1 Tax=Leptolyngbya boryana NIES-2135 TaxID=1973484 RepID=A0A1Z4JF70_LEPBY|nr:MULTISPECIES: thioredoxin [Leptolyngbya]BAY55396.1 thioredoxin [Leptolyngbya boryana NIES-2135]MBD2368451.1 thioredoxin [Leptolyngbya sp. FACHB-161]MBD2374893.1 thioredoxin [Leptolyngbya sp. FACHB-238]MBD2399313.1 thioredoxin [Leptolyngbya sp. FACHB-239]MBD2405518.1 thioredoxin [Leptolyngbya sp. FACHB-402]
MSSVLVIGDSEFEAEVLNATQPVLVYFWAEWCGPCRLMAPVIETIAKEYGDRLKVVKMEVDPNPESVKKFKVEGVPAFRLIQDGEMKQSAEGAMNKQKIEELLNKGLVTA